VFGQVFYIYGAKCAQADVEGDEGHVDSFDLEAFHELAGKVQTRGGGGYGAFIFSKDGLEPVFVFGFDLAFDVLGEWGLAQGLDDFVKSFRVSVEQEPDGTAAGGCIVDYLGYEVAIAEIEFIAYADLAGRVYEYVPEVHFGIELAEEEYLDLGAGFLLTSIQAGGEHHGVVAYHDIAFGEIVYNIFENLMFDFPGFAVYDHEAGFVPVLSGSVGNKAGGEFEFEFR